MKVYELIEILTKAQAGAEVMVAMQTTPATSIESAQVGIYQVTISGGDPMLFDSNGDEMGLLSKVTEAEDDSGD